MLQNYLSSYFKFVNIIILFQMQDEFVDNDRSQSPLLANSPVMNFGRR